MGVMGVWAVFCGALASNHTGWEGDSLLALAMVVLLAELGWGSFFDLATGTDWFQPSAGDRPPPQPPGRPALPYTQPDSPGGRILRGGSRARRWWRGPRPQEVWVTWEVVAGAVASGKGEPARCTASGLSNGMSRGGFSFSGSLGGESRCVWC